LLEAPLVLADGPCTRLAAGEPEARGAEREMFERPAFVPSMEPAMNRTDVQERSQQPTGQEQRTSTSGETATRHGSQSREAGRRLEMDRLRAAGKNLGTQLEEQVRKRPYVIIGAAAGAGFIAGSLLGSRLGQLLIAAGIGYAAREALEGGAGVDRIREGIEELTGERSQG
jgi:ElaB/YqjD/DUF883 family membrane-anchored ribosome-binding protein